MPKDHCAYFYKSNPRRNSLPKNGRRIINIRIFGKQKFGRIRTSKLFEIRKYPFGRSGTSDHSYGRWNVQTNYTDTGA